MDDLNAFQIDNGTTLNADICIIGGGAAGIAIAREFLGTKYRVLVLESGGYSYDDKTQSLYDFESIGHPLRAQQGYISRNRYLGGSTNTWLGRCAPLNSIDFEARDWVPDSGWPIQKTDLDPYYRRACELLKLPGYDNFHLPNWKKFVINDTPEFLDGRILCPELFLLANRPINIRSSYVSELNRSPNIQICINANVIEIESTEAQASIKRVNVSSLDGNRFFVQATIFVLACGGWENARLLLLSRRYNSNGLGNQHDNVGRYYAEHPKIKSGKIVPVSKILRSPIMFWKRRLNRDGYVRLGIKLSDEVQKKERLLNHYVELMYPDSMSEAIASSEELLRNLRFSRSAVHKMVKFAPHAFRLFDAFERMTFNLPLKFRYIEIYNHFEQVPDRNSRVMLGSQRDALGLNRLRVNLKVSVEEKRCMVRFQQILGGVFKEQGLGDLTIKLPAANDEWPDLTDSSHHVGTTRMSLDARKGVVDKNCCVHGIDNLFIASSSVFPTGGHVNPTLTIVAISLRLADHLKEAVLSKAPST